MAVSLLEGCEATGPVDNGAGLVQETNRMAIRNHQKRIILWDLVFIAFSEGYSFLIDADLYLKAARDRLLRDDVEITASTTGEHRPGGTLLVMLQDRP